MRLAFWRRGGEKAQAATALAKPAPAPAEAAAKLAVEVEPENGDLDLRTLGAALSRRKGWIIAPTLLAAALSMTAVNFITPRYKSEARILIDGRENVFLRPNGERNEERTALDAEAVTSQVQLVLSRDLAREIIKKNKLAERPEFDPVLEGVSPLKSLLALVGRRPRSLFDDAGRARPGRLFRSSDRLRGRQVARHRRRIPVARSGTGGARRQLDRRRLSGAAAGRAAGAGQIRQPVAVGRNRKPAPQGRGTRSRGSRISARNRACSSAPTIPRCPISRWASSIRNSTTRAR